MPQPLHIRRLRGLSFAFSCLIPSALAFAGADLGWDLSYRTAIENQKMDAREFLPYWISMHPSRPVHTKMKEYIDSAIEGSVLIEQPDSHTGSPMATWFIRTRTGATVCTFHKEFMNNPCEPLNRKKMDQFIDELRAFAVLPAPKDASKAVVSRAEDGQPIFFNYVGFLSIYQHGTTMQRPIAMVERFMHIPGRAPTLDPQAGRLDRAIARLVLDDSAFKKRQAEIEARSRRSQLTEAVRQGKLIEVTQLLDQGESVNVETWDTPPLLAVAAANGQAAMVELLLKRGAQINAMESAALKAAVRAKDISMAALLLDKGAAVDPPKDSLVGYHDVFQSPLGLAVQSGQFEMTKYLIDKGADVNFEQSTSPLSAAVINLDLRMVDLLLAHGADPNGKGDDQGTSPLITLMSYGGRLGGLPQEPDALQQIGKTEARLAMLVRHLVAGGADVNLATKGCQTAYLEASDHQSTTMKTLLLELGADPKAHETCRSASASCQRNAVN